MGPPKSDLVTFKGKFDSGLGRAFAQEFAYCVRFPHPAKSWSDGRLALLVESLEPALPSGLMVEVRVVFFQPVQPNAWPQAYRRN